MKSILICSVTVLALAGCTSQADYQTSYAGYRDLGFSYDYVPRPVKGLTPDDTAQAYGATPGPTSQAVGQGQ